MSAPPTILFDLDGTLVTYPDWPPRPFPGAADVLRAFRRAGWTVVLYSMGDRTSRLVTLRRAGLNIRLFDRVRPVPSKDPVTLERTLADVGARGPVAVVGDSWRLDVLPALGRADAVFWVRGGRPKGAPGTPPDPSRYPVQVVRSVAELTPDAALAAARVGYDKAAWADAYLREADLSRPAMPSPDRRRDEERKLVVALEHLYDGGPYTQEDFEAFARLGVGPKCRQETALGPDRPWEDDSLDILDRRLARGWSPKAVAAFLNRSVRSVHRGIALLARREKHPA